MKKHLSPLKMYLSAVLINIIPFILFGLIIKPSGEAGLIVVLSLIIAGICLLAYLPYLLLDLFSDKLYLTTLFFLPSALIFAIIKIWTEFTSFHFDELIYFLWIPLIPNLIIQAVFSVRFIKHKKTTANRVDGSTPN